MDGTTKPLSMGEEVIVIDDGQGYYGRIQKTVVDKSGTLWYEMKFRPKDREDEDEGWDDRRVTCFNKFST